MMMIMIMITWQMDTDGLAEPAASSKMMTGPEESNMIQLTSSDRQIH